MDYLRVLFWECCKQPTHQTVLSEFVKDIPSVTMFHPFDPSLLLSKERPSPQYVWNSHQDKPKRCSLHLFKQGFHLQVTLCRFQDGCDSKMQPLFPSADKTALFQNPVQQLKILPHKHKMVLAFTPLHNQVLFPALFECELERVDLSLEEIFQAQQKAMAPLLDEHKRVMDIKKCQQSNLNQQGTILGIRLGNLKRRHKMEEQKLKREIKAFQKKRAELLHVGDMTCEVSHHLISLHQKREQKYKTWSILERTHQSWWKDDKNPHPLVIAWPCQMIDVPLAYVQRWKGYVQTETPPSSQTWQNFKQLHFNAQLFVLKDQTCQLQTQQTQTIDWSTIEHLFIFVK